MDIRPGIYKHYKGQEYQVYSTAQHSETNETVVVYRCLYGNYDLWVRPLEMFLEDVFIDNKNIPRFEYIRAGDSTDLPPLEKV